LKLWTGGPALQSYLLTYGFPAERPYILYIYSPAKVSITGEAENWNKLKVHKNLTPNIPEAGGRRKKKKKF
jgi:hypothetical protein